jgi:hypothetical protein
MNPYIIGGGVAAIALLGFLLKGSYERNGELEAKLETQAAETQECVDANVTTMTTISELTEEISSMIEERRIDTERREQVLVERERELAAANARADRMERERQDEVLDNEECRNLTMLRVDQFCPATASQLRDRSRSTSGDQDGDSGEGG